MYPCRTRVHTTVCKISEGRLPKATLQPPLAAIKGDVGLKNTTQDGRARSTKSIKTLQQSTVSFVV